MRVGFISTYPPIECGIATYTQYLGEALRKKNTDVYVVCHVGGSGSQVFPAFDYEDGDLAEKAFSMMARFTPDVVHIQHEFGLFGKHQGVAVIPLIMQFRLVGIPVVVTLHTVYPEISEDHRLILQAIVSNSQRVIVHETYQEESLRKILNKELQKKILLIPHGAREVSPIPEAKKILGIPEEKKMILLIGYFRPSKNFEQIIDIFPQVVKKVPEAVLVIAGKIRGIEHIDYRDMLLSKINHSPYKEKIYFIRGQLTQHVFDTIISASDVVALPYKIVSQSGILAHCLAFGKPLVTSESEALKQVLKKSQAGIICKNNKEFIDNTAKILSEESLSREMSKNAKKYVDEVVSWSRVAAQHRKLYFSLLNKEKIESRIISVG